MLYPERDPFYAILSQNSAPQGVVEVGYQDLRRPCDESVQETKPFGRHAQQAVRRKRHPHRKPLELVTPALASAPRHQSVIIQQVDAAMLRDEALEFLVDLQDTIRLP